SARSKADSSPPTMIDSCALIAPISPPLTGASSIAPPLSATSFASRWVAVGEILLMSMTIAPRGSVERTPSCPVSTNSTSDVSGTIVMTIVDCRATSAGDVPALAPAAATSSTAPRLRLWTTSENPALMRFFAMGLPMTPSPTKPIVSAIEGYNPTYETRDCCGGVSQPGGSSAPRRRQRHHLRRVRRSAHRGSLHRRLHHEQRSRDDGEAGGTGVEGGSRIVQRYLARRP